MASICVKKGRIYLRASLPEKSGVGPWRQQTIPLGLDDTPTNQRTAKAQLKELHKQLDQQTFEWDYWLENHSKGVTWNKAIRMLYRKKVELGRTKQTTWDNNYSKRFSKVNPNSPMTSTSVANLLQEYARDSNSYKELYFLLKHMCDLTKVAFPEVPVPTYVRSQPRRVPTDKEIVEAVLKLDGHEQWCLGMLATYGLRPEEVDYAVVNENDDCDLSKAKTMSGAPDGRVVMPLMEEWVELFDLRVAKPRPKRGTRDPESTRNDLTAQFFYKIKRKLGVDWTAYALRHAFARRIWEEGGAELDLYTAAEQMGHTVDEHLKTYRRHINRESKARAARDAIKRNRQKKAAAALSADPAPAPQRKG